MKNCDLEINNAINARILSRSNGNDLVVELDDGRRGIIPSGELSRRVVRNEAVLNNMIGSSISIMELGTNADGALLVSGKKYEEAVFDQVAGLFERGIRNVYTGTFNGHTDKVVFYKIAQGVNVGVHIKNLCYSRINNLYNCVFPKQLQLVIASVDREKGFIYASAKPAFGNTAEEMARLDLTSGCIRKGQVTGIVNGDAVVSLAPNLVGLLSGSCGLKYGAIVEVLCTSVDYTKRKVRLQLNRILENDPAWYFEDYLSEISKPWIDLDKFEDELGPAKTVKKESLPVVAKHIVAEPNSTDNADTDASDKKPFLATFPNEKVIYPPTPPAYTDNIIFETTKGYLTNDHMRVAKAVGQLKYITTNLLIQTNVFDGDRAALNKIIDRLVRLQIVSTLKFKSDAGTAVTHVLFPGRLYKSFAGRAINHFWPSDYQNSPAKIKQHLAANQLFINALHWIPDVLSSQTMPILVTSESKVRPKAIISTSSHTYLIDAVRHGQIDEFIGDKLLRYEQVLSAKKDELHPILLIAVEDEAVAAELHSRVQSVTFSLWITHDLAVANKSDMPEFKKILPPANLTKSNGNSNLFRRAFGLFGLI